MQKKTLNYKEMYKKKLYSNFTKMQKFKEMPSAPGAHNAF